jgi:hypothetical protein
MPYKWHGIVAARAKVLLHEKEKSCGYILKQDFSF